MTDDRQRDHLADVDSRPRRPVRASEVAMETMVEPEAIVAARAVRAKRARQTALRKAADHPGSPNLADDLERRVEASRQASVIAFKARKAAARKLKDRPA